MANLTAEQAAQYYTAGLDNPKPTTTGWHHRDRPGRERDHRAGDHLAIPNGAAQITGGFTQAQATQLANVLQYGSLPLNFKILTADTVSASLGHAQLVGGLIAAAIGLGLVVIYSFLYYRGLGLVSVFSLVIAGGLAVLAVMLLTKYQNFALELSGIAGLIVAIGITADSFVVFFERLRDEVREGKALRPAVEAGWKRARRTILVSDTVSFIAAILLYYFSIGEVKGFAYTLGLTTLIDIIVVFLFTKPMVTLLARTKFYGDGTRWSGLDPARLGARTPWRSSVRRTQVSEQPRCPAPQHGVPQLRGGMMSRLGQIGGRLYRGEVSYDFVGRKRRWYAISGAILLISIVALFARGLDFSVDFKGGAVFQFSAPSATQTQVQNTVSHTGVNGAVVQQLTGKLGNKSWQVQTDSLTSQQTFTVENALTSQLDAKDMSTSFVGASWGGQITTKAIEALITFLIVIVLYLSIAFEWKMAVAAFVALIHDLVIATGVYALTGFQVSPATVIGLLTILGYSLYDTVVVFDKVRENTAGLLGGARSTYSEAANLALNQTLVRSINTSIIALLPVAAILFVGGGLLGAGELKDLSLVLLVGMLSGTYSSIFIATPVLADLKEREPQYKALAKRVSVRAAGGRAAKRAAAKAGSRSGTAAAQAPLPEEDADDVEVDTDYDDAAPPADALTTTASRVPAARGTPGTARPGPRQQPRRTGGSARHRPAGKKKRR